MMITDALRIGNARGMSSLCKKRGRTSSDDLRDLGYEAPVLPSTSACCRYRAVLGHVHVSSPRTSCARGSAVQELITSEQVPPSAAVPYTGNTVCAVTTAANTMTAPSGLQVGGSISGLGIATASLSSVAAFHAITPAVGATVLQPSIPPPASGPLTTPVLLTVGQHQQQANQQHQDGDIPQQLHYRGRQFQLSVPRPWGSLQGAASFQVRIPSNAAQHAPCVVEHRFQQTDPLSPRDKVPQLSTEPWHDLLLQDMLPLGVEQWAAALDVEGMQAGQMGIFSDSSEWDDAEGHDDTSGGAEVSDYEDAYSEYGTTEEEEENNAIPPADLEAIREEQAQAWTLEQEQA